MFNKVKALVRNQNPKGKLQMSFLCMFISIKVIVLDPHNHGIPGSDVDDWHGVEEYVRNFEVSIAWKGKVPDLASQSFIYFPFTNPKLLPCLRWWWWSLSSPPLTMAAAKWRLRWSRHKPFSCIWRRREREFEPRSPGTTVVPLHTTDCTPPSSTPQTQIRVTTTSAHRQRRT